MLQDFVGATRSGYMFDFLRRSEEKPKSLAEKLLSCAGPYSAQLVVEYPKILKLSPDPNKAVLEIFLFKLWACYQVSGEILFPADANVPKMSREEAFTHMRAALAVDSETKGINLLAKNYGFKPSKFSNAPWKHYIESSLKGYDRSVVNHQGPAWNSAIIKLKTMCGIPFGIIVADMKAGDTLTKEALTVYDRVERTCKAEAVRHLT